MRLAGYSHDARGGEGPSGGGVQIRALESPVEVSPSRNQHHSVVEQPRRLRGARGRQVASNGECPSGWVI